MHFWGAHTLDASQRGPFTHQRRWRARAGWDLLQSLLAPRHIDVDNNGGVSFVNDTPFSRISAYEALKHRCACVHHACRSTPWLPPHPPPHTYIHKWVGWKALKAATC